QTEAYYSIDIYNLTKFGKSPERVLSDDEKTVATEDCDSQRKVSKYQDIGHPLKFPLQLIAETEGL
ncbi:MAG: hypothetical protein P8Z40_13030, partial [Chloroflexota bacterium]